VRRIKDFRLIFPQKSGNIIQCHSGAFHAARGSCTKYFIIFILLIGMLGAFLRLYQIDAQVTGDDEWHGISVAAHSSLPYILTHFHSSDNCIPLTAYYKLLLETIGLDEFGLHSLQILLGVLSLIVFPLIIKSIFQERIAIIFSFLLAISPFLTYYSRYARPYIVVVFLSFIATFSFYFWIRENKIMYIIGYLLTAILAPYFLLPSLISVITPLLYTATFLMMEKSFLNRSNKPICPKLIHIFYAGILLFFGLAILFLPTIHSLGVISEKVHGDGSGININTIIGALQLFSGSTSRSISIMFVSFFVYGAYRLYKKNLFLFGYVLSIISLQILSLVIVQPAAVGDPEVFARYSICSLPLWLLLFSVGLNDASLRLGELISKKRNELHNIPHIFLIGFFLIIFLKGPILTIYKKPNNFTNHNDFQSDYMYTWTKSDLYSLRNPIPKFYFYLRETKDSTIIETPFLIHWIGNNYHIYQRLHSKSVIIGHNHDSYLAQSDTVMHANIRLKNFVDIENVEEIAKSNASFIVVHKDLLNEFLFMRKNFPDFQRWVEALEKNRDHYEQLFGIPAREEAEKSIAFLKHTLGNPPFYQDRLIVVFKIK
jgi:hypothetical protein